VWINKEEILKEVEEEDCWKDLSAKEKKMFLAYCVNGLDYVKAYKDVYMDTESSRVVKFPGDKAAIIVAKDSFQECFEIYGEALQEAASTKTNAHLYNQYVIMATANLLDYVDEIGQFKFKSIQEAKDILGEKALAIVGFQVSVHPKDPKKTMTVPVLADKMKAMKELAKFSKLFGEAESGGKGLGTISIDLGNAVFNKEEEDRKRKELGVV
jgi:hypothetical protein